MIRHYIIYGNAKEPKQNLSQQWVADNASAWLVVEENNRHRTIQSYHNKASCAWLAVEEHTKLSQQSIVRLVGGRREQSPRIE